MSVLLTTDRNNSGFKLIFQRISEKEFEIIRTPPNIIGGTVESKDFLRLTCENYMAKDSVWIDIRVQQVKNNRSYVQGICLDKKQAELLIKELQSLVDKMIY